MKKYNLIIDISSILIIGFTLLFNFWKVYPYKIVEWTTETYPVLTPIVYAGDNLLIESSYCKYYDLQPEITRVFKDGLVFYTPSFLGSTDKGCKTDVIAIEVPKNLPPAIYVVDQVIKYQPNPIREITYIRSTDSFQVIAREVVE